MTLLTIRIAVIVLSFSAVAVAVVPILVLIDLVSGGNGYGLCSGGLEACDRPYTTGAELMVLLILGLSLIVIAIRLLMKLARRLREDTYQASQ